jgi:hypothetical protein
MICLSLHSLAYLVEEGMTEREQVDAFAEDLGKLIDRYRSEFDLTIAGVLGVLECAKLEIWEDSRGDDFEIEFE